MTEPIQPSAGASRAAIALIRDASKGKAGVRSDVELMAQPITHRVAHIIDRESGLAKLLEAAEPALEQLIFYRKKIREMASSHDMGNAVPATLEQAIAKCERGE